MKHDEIILASRIVACRPPRNISVWRKCPVPRSISNKRKHSISG